MIKLNGSYEEGGGALVRTALAFSVLTGKEFKVDKIRSRRPNPGLKPQHLTAIKALTEICNAETSKIELGSTELWFKPGKIKRGIYEIDIGTAGSITLLLQALILPCLFAPGKITLNIKGGTCGKWQASVDYLQNILLPYLPRFVDKIELKIMKRGYFPKGGGLITLEITPRFKFNNFHSFYEELELKTSKIKLTEQGELEQIRGVVNVSQELQDKDVGERIKKAAESSLKQYGAPINLRIDYAQALSIGGEILVWGIFSKHGKIDYDNPIILTGDALVDKRKSSEEIGKEAAEKLKKQIDENFAIDHYLSDQLIPFMGLIPGSEINTKEISKHAKTNIYVVEKFLPVEFKIENNKISVEKN